MGNFENQYKGTKIHSKVGLNKFAKSQGVDLSKF